MGSTISSAVVKGAFIKGKPNPLVRAPFNYVTLEARLAEVYRRYRRPVSLPEEVYIQVIKACRQLRTEMEVSAHFANKPVVASSTHRPSLLKTLHLEKCRSMDVETKLLGRFVSTYSAELYQSLSIKSPLGVFLTCSPAPSAERIVALFRDIPVFSRATMDVSIAFLALRVMLQVHGDYYSAFKLIDETVNHRYFLLGRETRLLRSVVPQAALWYCGIHGVAEVAARGLGLESTWVMHYNVGMLAVAYLSAMASFLFVRNLRYPLLSTASRVQWRSNTSMGHRIYHHVELKMMDRIVAAFEETQERNPMNFHLGADWILPELVGQHMVQQGLILEEELREERQKLITSPKTDKLRRQLHHQLRVRRMMLQEDEAQVMFKEYWMNSGDGFEWVEPDQDPAELTRSLNGLAVPPPRPSHPV